MEGRLRMAGSNFRLQPVFAQELSFSTRQATAV
jgi:hypothetical protein